MGTHRSFTLGFILEVIGSIFGALYIFSLLWWLGARFTRFGLLEMLLIYFVLMNFLCLLFSIRMRAELHAENWKSALVNALLATIFAIVSINIITMIGARFTLGWVDSEARPRLRPSVGSYDEGSKVHVSFFSSKEKQKGKNEDLSPVFQAHTIEKAILSDDKILRDSSGKKVGSLEKAIFSNDQIIRNSDGRKVGTIEENILDKALWGLNTQSIKDANGKKIGEITTDIWGSRVITDKDGKEVGLIRKDLFGDTVIDKLEDGDDWISIILGIAIGILKFLILVAYFLARCLYIGVRYAASRIYAKIKAS